MTIRRNRERRGSRPTAAVTREEWQIEKLVPGGAALARRSDGSIGFVDGALPGERVVVSEIERKKGYARARRFVVLAAAPERVTPSCPHAARCGGCDWLHVEYAAQLRYKSSLLAEALARTGGFTGIEAIEVVASPKPSGHRSRIRLHIDGRGRIGFFAAQTHELVCVEHCQATSPELDAAFAVLRAAAERSPACIARFEQAELRVSPLPPERALFLIPRGPALPHDAALTGFLDELRGSFSVSVAGTSTSEPQRFPLANDLVLEVLPGAFVQVNWDVNRLLVDAVLSGARARQARTFLDLYAGAGNFTLPLARAGLSGVAVEENALAASSAARALARPGFAPVRVVTGDVAAALVGITPGEHDLAILDPPRAGAAAIVETLAALAPRHIAYCACDPVTLARDLARFVRLGYRLAGVRGFDMFPGTHHVETLAWLTHHSVE